MSKIGIFMFGFLNLVKGQQNYLLTSQTVLCMKHVRNVASERSCSACLGLYLNSRSSPNSSKQVFNLCVKVCTNQGQRQGERSRPSFIKGGFAPLSNQHRIALHMSVNLYSKVVTHELYNGVHQTALSAIWYSFTT